MDRFPTCPSVTRHAGYRLGFAASGLLALIAVTAHATPLHVVNPGFEDVSGQSAFNEFTFGTPAGWELYDPADIVPDLPADPVYVGTLEPNGTDFFDTTAPEGDRVAILFGRNAAGGRGEYGFQQTLADVLTAGTHYALSVEVGNIASGVARSGEFFDLDGFPGYRIELLAGGQPIAVDDDGLGALIPEGEFATATLSLRVGDTHPLLGERLGVRLVNLNRIPAGLGGVVDLDIEVDFDDVRLLAQATTVPTASGRTLLGTGALVLVALAGRRRAWRQRPRAVLDRTRLSRSAGSAR